jgi:hypothetical protein
MDEKTVEELLREEIRYEIGYLGQQDVGSEGYKNGIDGVIKLMDRWVEVEKVDLQRKQHSDESEQRKYEYEAERALKEKELAEEKKDRLIKNILAGAGIGIPAIITIWGTLKTFRFEETGTITTTLGRGFINKLLSRK